MYILFVDTFTIFQYNKDVEIHRSSRLFAPLKTEYGKEDGRLLSRECGLEVKCIALAGNLFHERRVVQMISFILSLCTIVGAIAGVCSLVFYLHDRKKK